ncbi:MAG: glycoside hydrolase family 43 [Alphaproteobacteria bacterium]|nr:MAG: glycoside hydrolase family 43 [Alphaproteobacteria bacterium]
MLSVQSLQRLRRPVVIGLGALAVGIGLASCALLAGLDELPQGITSGNGRLEAREIDIIARYPGRLIDIRVEEGDIVEAGQVLAVLDTRELEAALRAAEARVARARQGRAISLATIAQNRSTLSLAAIELERAQTLHHRGFAPEQFLDQRRASRQTAAAALAAAQGGLSAAEADMDAAAADADRIREQIAEATLRAPKAGRVLYRLAEAGELIAAGGPVLTVLDLSDVYMTIFLPTREAGALGVGAEARLVLDAAEEEVLPARVSFVSPEAQFTPRQVETKSEREALMYRVRVRLSEEVLAQRIGTIRTGVTGVAYVQLDPRAQWPARLATDFVGE